MRYLSRNMSKQIYAQALRGTDECKRELYSILTYENEI